MDIFYLNLTFTLVLILKVEMNYFSSSNYNNFYPYVGIIICIFKMFSLTVCSQTVETRRSRYAVGQSFTHRNLTGTGNGVAAREVTPYQAGITTVSVLTDWLLPSHRFQIHGIHRLFSG